MKNKREIIIFFIFLLVAAFFIKPYVTSGNSASRYATIESLVEQQSLIIDNSSFMGDSQSFNIEDNEIKPLMRRNSFVGINGTNDKIYVNGNFYSDKPIFSALVGVPIYAILYHVFGLSFSENGSIVVFLLKLFLGVVLGAMTTLVFYSITNNFSLSEKRRLVLAGLFGFSTFIITYSTDFNNHLVAAFCIVYCLKILLDIKHNKKMFSKMHFILIGLFSALSATIDLVVGGIFFLVLSGYMFQKHLRRGLLFFMIGIIPVALIHTIGTIPVTGSVFPGSMHPEYWNYEGSDFSQETLSGTGMKHTFSSFLVYSFHKLFGYFGLFSYTPILLFGLWYLIKEIRERKTFRNEAILALVVIVATISYYLLFTNNYGGWSYGVRWFVPLIPLFFLTLPRYYEHRKIPYKKVFILFAMWSLFTAFVGATEVWADNYGYDIFYNQNIPLLNNIKNFIQGLSP